VLFRSRAIEDGIVTKVSMGAEVLGSTCSVCGKFAGAPWEYCFTADTDITMEDGTFKKISEIREGDKVLTHTEQAKKVTNNLWAAF